MRVSFQKGLEDSFLANQNKQKSMHKVRCKWISNQKCRLLYNYIMKPYYDCTIKNSFSNPFN